MEIYRYLRDRNSATVGEVVDFVDLTQPTVSYHLGEMKKNGILKSVKKGKEVHYSVSPHCPHMEAECILEGVNFKQISHV